MDELPVLWAPFFISCWRSVSMKRALAEFLALMVRPRFCCCDFWGWKRRAEAVGLVAVEMAVVAVTVDDAERQADQMAWRSSMIATIVLDSDL